MCEAACGAETYVMKTFKRQRKECRFLLRPLRCCRLKNSVEITLLRRYVLPSGNKFDSLSFLTRATLRANMAAIEMNPYHTPGYSDEQAHLHIVNRDRGPEHQHQFFRFHHGLLLTKTPVFLQGMLFHRLAIILVNHACIFLQRLEVPMPGVLLYLDNVGAVCQVVGDMGSAQVMNMAPLHPRSRGDLREHLLYGPILERFARPG